MDENTKDLEKHKQIVLIEEYTKVLDERLYKTTEDFFTEITKDKQCSSNILVSSYYNAGIRYINNWLLFMDVVGIKVIDFIDFEKIQESREIVDLEDKYGTE